MLVLAAGWIVLLALPVAALAHGGVASLQVVAERVNPGGTLELLGDMASEGPVDIAVAAEPDGTARSLGHVQADAEGHFQAFLTVPADLPSGTYAVLARAGAEEARSSVVVSGPPIGDEGGDQAGQDEPLVVSAPIPASQGPAAPAATLDRSSPVPTGTGADVGFVAIVGAIGLVAAPVIGAMARARSLPSPDSHRRR
jgi:hypothetical protein